MMSIFRHFVQRDARTLSFFHILMPFLSLEITFLDELWNFRSTIGKPAKKVHILNSFQGKATKPQIHKSDHKPYRWSLTRRGPGDLKSYSITCPVNIRNKINRSSNIIPTELVFSPVLVPTAAVKPSVS